MSTSAKGKFAESFNDWVIKFFRELIKMYPQNQDFKNAKNQMMITAQSPKYELGIQYFEQYIGVYRKHLREKNEKFFLEFDLKGTTMEYFNYVKDLWLIADDDTKKTMWNYFTIFDKLSEKYSSL